MNVKEFHVSEFDVKRFDSILARGLCQGAGNRESQMCIEAAICTVLDLPHGDDPGCVSEAIRQFKIRLNDSDWSTPEARAKGLRNLGLAQLGSKGVVNDVEFASKMAMAVTTRLVPKLFREIFKDNPDLLAHADKCEAAGDLGAARAARAASDAASCAASCAARAARAASCAASCAARAYAASCAASDAASDAASAASYAASAASYAASDAASAASYAASAASDAASKRDEYLNFVAGLALEVLIELKSPGYELL